MSHYIGSAPKKKRAPRPGTPLIVVARRKLPEIKEWIRKGHQRGTVITRATIRDEGPGLSHLAWSTREALSFCVCRLLREDKTLAKQGEGTFRVMFAL